MENDFQDVGKSRRVTPGAKVLMALVVVITAIAIWLVPVDEKVSPPALPELTSAPGTTEPLALPDAPGARPSTPDAELSGSLSTPPDTDASEARESSPAAGTSESLSLPPPPGGIATVTGGGEGARAYLYELQAGGAQPDPDVVYAEAERLQVKGDLENAYLLYRYAARHDQVEAAMALGTSADPAYHSATRSYLPEPSPGQAHKWYSMAATAGDKEASQRLQALRGRVEQDAAAGDKQAQRLLLQWQ
jgi:hypothetical protein